MIPRLYSCRGMTVYVRTDENGHTRWSFFHCGVSGRSDSKKASVLYGAIVFHAVLFCGQRSSPHFLRYACTRQKRIFHSALQFYAVLPLLCENCFRTDSSLGSHAQENRLRMTAFVVSFICQLSCSAVLILTL